MPESTATIIPPVPEVIQNPNPSVSQRTDLTELFNKALPEVKKEPTRSTSSTPTPTQTPPPPVTPPKEPPQEAAKPDPTKPQETAQPPAEEPHVVPTSIEELLDGKAPAESTPAAPAVDEFPEELPVTKSPEESKKNWKGLREAYRKTKDELKALQERPAATTDEVTKDRLVTLEADNKKMAELLSRTSVERHQDFQNKIIAPMRQAWTEAARIVKESGGDPQDLQKALSMSGRAQFEALDTLFQNMPESAKMEANQAISSYRKFEDMRRRALADAPKVAEQLRKADAEREIAFIDSQKKQLAVMFDNAVTRLRDEAKLEVFQRATGPDGEKWNKQMDDAIATSRKLFLDNADMNKVAMATLLAPLADVYRKMWFTERVSRKKAEKILKEKFGSEPNMSESGGNVRGETPSLEDDLKKPITDVFLREFHKARGG